MAIFLATLIALYGLFLLIIGMPEQYIYESVVLIGDIPERVHEEGIRFHPDGARGLLTFLSPMVLIAGLLTRKLAIAWQGLLILFAFSGLFLFSVGATLLPIDVILLILLSNITLQRRSRVTRQSLKAFTVDAANVMAILLATLVALYGLFLLIAVSPGTHPDVPRGLLTFLSPMVLIAGLLTRKLAIAWLGLLVFFVFSAFFLFSVGAGLLPTDGILLILLSIITILRRNMRS